MKKLSYLPHFLLALVLTMGLGVAASQIVSAQTAIAAPNTVATGSITGKVVDASGNPVGGAIVHLMKLPKGMMGGRHGRHGHGKRPAQPQPGQTIWHHTTFGVTKTADDGTFTVSNAPVGLYRIMAMDRGVGFGHVRRPVKVGVGKDTSAGTITLHKGRKMKRHPH